MVKFEKKLSKVAMESMTPAEIELFYKKPINTRKEKNINNCTQKTVEQRRKYQRLWRQSYNLKNHDIVIEKRKIYRQKNAPRIKERHKEYYKLNRPIMLQKCKDYYKKNKEKKLAYYKTWKEKNPNYHKNYYMQKCLEKKEC